MPLSTTQVACIELLLLLLMLLLLLLMLLLLLLLLLLVLRVLLALVVLLALPLCWVTRRCTILQLPRRGKEEVRDVFKLPAP